MNNIMHRDIKPENILFVNGNFGEGNGKIKLIDFGTAMIFEQGEKYSEFYGSPAYVAPDVVYGRYTEKCDIWSVGVIMYLLLGLKLPFNGLSDEDVMNNALT